MCAFFFCKGIVRSRRFYLYGVGMQANMMGKGAFITMFTSESVKAAAKANPQQFTVATEKEVLASEEMLRVILVGCSS